MAVYPMGLTGQAAIQLVREYVDEPSLPVDTTILSFLNRGVEQVSQRISGIFAFASYPTVNLQTYIELNSDIWYIASANFSSGAVNNSGLITSSSPFSQGSLVYPMMALDQATFMDAAAGFPAVGFGPPQAYMIYSDQGYPPGTTLPAPTSQAIVVITGTSNGVSYWVVTTYVNPNGETTGSSPIAYSPTTVQQGAVISPQGISNADGYNIYIGSSSSGPFYLQNTSPIGLGTPYTIPGTPTLSGTQPPSSNTATGAGQGGAIFMQLYPSAMIGQVNLYYRQRPALWTSATSGTDNTSLDTSAQEAVVIYAVIRTLQSRGRAAEAKTIWKPEYDEQIAYLTELIKLRTVPRSGQVRDVTNRSFPSSPWWMTE